MNHLLVILVRIVVGVFMFLMVGSAFREYCQERWQRAEYLDLARDFVEVRSESGSRSDIDGPLETLPPGDTDDVSGASAKIHVDASTPGGTPNSSTRLKVDFGALKAINPNVVGWVYIEGTPVCYPVVQATDNTRYLTESFRMEPSRVGAIFLDSELSMDLSSILILYGHNMGIQRDEMFSTLRGYDESDFAREHGEVIMATPGGGETAWTVFAVVHAGVEEEVFRREDFGDSKDFSEYICAIKTRQLFDMGVEPSDGSRILVLSTCIGGSRVNERRLIFAYS